jgi:two-component system, chemotaxis family, sensor kinase CheA
MPTDASPPDDGSGFAEFLADYFMECDEHLSIARRTLLGLEESLRIGIVERNALDELFRSFHSLKGLSAMVGFHEAEQLAHHLESYLGPVRKGQSPLNDQGLETLIEGVARLEQVIAARRDAAPPPDVAELTSRLAELTPIAAPNERTQARQAHVAPAVDSASEREALIAEKVARGARAWRIHFSPSAELVSRGVDVNSVRRKLQSLGEIVHSAPVVEAGGGIRFAFDLVSTAPAGEVLALSGEGLRCEAYEPPAAPSTPPPFARSTEEGQSTHLTPANLVRVDLHRLDELMRLVGELVLSRARLDEGLARIEPVAPAAEMRVLRETSSGIERQLRDLREGVMRVRMVPVREVFARMQFVVRDLVREMGKRVALRLSGEETQIDKYIVERIMDPLLHLVRNAVSHGLEPAEQREAAGKPVEGQLHLSARTTGETVVIHVEDDGRGIDVDHVLTRARALGMEVPPLEAGERVDPTLLLDALCIPGLSTRERSDRISGRGIGMDVVRKSVEELGGSLGLHTEAGRGVRFEIQLPLTLAITDALIVQSGGERYAVPQVAVREIIRLESSDSSTIMGKNELLSYRQGALPLVRLSHLFGTLGSPRHEHYALVVGEGVQSIAIVVDRVLGSREIVVRPLTDRLVQVAYVAGATELGDGRVVLILDTANLSRGLRKRGAIHVPHPPHASAMHE